MFKIYKRLFANYPPENSVILDFIGAFFVLVVMSAVFIFGYYALTGEYLDFSAGQP